ncbi:MAG: energy-coupling factor ABC transporter substrate-binding protein [Clostridiales bacterium]|nr:energy-coupling factor ABC transporter substrate-binding protein [Clostridiales bacterium]
MKKSTIVIILSVVIVLMAFIPLFALKDAEFGGSDDAGSTVVEEVNSGFEPIAAPLIENILGGELPGEVESLLFCVQTGIGVGIISFCMGRLVERKKLGKGE